MKYYPVFLDLKGRTCLVVGGGVVAERKVRSLVAAGARVTVVSPSVSPGLASLAAEGSIVHKKNIFVEADLDGAFLAVAATDDRGLNERITEACRGRGILVNSVTSPAGSSFIVPSVVERGDLLIALSTSGASPALARRMRERLEKEFGPEYADLLDALGRLRKELPKRILDEATRRRLYETVLDSDILTLLRQGNKEGAERLIREFADRAFEKGQGSR